ncbi:MAG: hypothetical protein ACHQ52_08140 [Candidatus Eisenbacteria bacterium]
MSIDRPGFEPAVQAARVWTIVLLLAGAATRAGATGYNWINAAGGSASTSTNWSPIGVPGAADDGQFALNSAYTVLWSSPADTIRSLTLVNTSPRFAVTARLGVAFHPLLENNTFLTITSGRIDGPTWSMIENNSSASLTVDGTNTQAWAMTPAATSVFGSTGGSAALTIQNGGSFRSAGDLSFAPGASNTMSVTVSDHPGSQASVLGTTTLGDPAHGWIAIGDYGQATAVLRTGGMLNPGGALFIGRHPGATGKLQILTDLGVKSIIDARGPLYIGANDQAAVTGGSGVAEIRLGTVSVQGRCWLGDPDEAPGGPVRGQLWIGGPSNVVFAGGITMNDALSGELDLSSGVTQVIGGTSTIKQAAPFQIGTANTGAPELWLENGSITDLWPNTSGAPTLGLGRGSSGKLRVAGSGTQLTVHGRVVMGDSAYEAAEMDVDSAATVTIQGALLVDANFYYSNILVRGAGSSLTVQDTTTLGGPVSSSVNFTADSSATVSLMNGTVLAGLFAANAYLFAQHDAHVSTHGLTMGPGYGFMRPGSGARVDVTDHFDMTGQALAEVDTEGVLAYVGGTRPLTVGANGPRMFAFSGGLIQATPEIDVRGDLILSVYGTDLVTQNAATRRMDRPLRPAVTLSSFAPAVVQSPLTRVLGAGSISGLGVIQGRLYIDAATGLLSVAAPYGGATGRLVVGDSTMSDGFASAGQTTIGNGDTLLVLDSNGGDLGKMRIDDGVLQLPKTGHLKAGFVLAGSGTVVGSLDVRDSAWVSYHGQITGDLALAGTFDLGPSVAALVTGSFHPTATGVTTLKVGHTQQDLILAIGPVPLAGSLDVRSISGDAPAVGDTFVVILGSVSGAFANVTVNGKPGAGVVHVLVDAGEVRVAVVGAVTGVGDPPVTPTAAPGSLRFATVGPPRDAALALDLPSASGVRVTLYDVSGRQVSVLADAELAAGRHRFELGRVAGASAMYFARAEVRGADGTRVLTTRAVVLR